MTFYTKAEFTCSRDGLTIAGTQYIPTKGDRLPILILSHGFMANQGSVRRYAKRMAREGYACFIFDFNGGGLKSKSAGKKTDMTVFTEVADLKAVLAYARSLSCTNSSDVTLMGCSQGGFVSAITAAELKDDINRIVLFYPALCIPDDARKGHMMFAEFDPQNIPEIIHCGPMTLGRDYAGTVMNVDAFELIEPYQGEVLIVHGTKDPIVDYSYAVRANERYQNSRLVTIENGGHGFRGKYDRQATAALVSYLKK
ncbi:MAG: alpha/beta fold hydrolase [Lachnospiraceae bacterium]|nr:alpha/beta fold hydrolase [Lachnospiraceae bacterium]